MRLSYKHIMAVAMTAVSGAAMARRSTRHISRTTISSVIP